MIPGVQENGRKASKRVDSEGIDHKKRRQNNPGIRVQGGRIYDSEKGTTCHQCRQKTVETKAKCGSCTLYWCPRCLLNRYGEDVEKVSAQAKWDCPRCRALCNCSNCRKKAGKEATGILSAISKAGGYNSVCDMLQKIPEATRSQIVIKEKTLGVKTAAVQKLKGSKRPLKRPCSITHAQSVSLPGIPEQGKEEPFCILKPGGRAAGPFWTFADRVDIPQDCRHGDVVQLLEFLKVFGCVFPGPLPHPAVIAADLLQPARTKQKRGCSSDSPVAAVHVTLLALVQKELGRRHVPSLRTWQEDMKPYLKKVSEHKSANSETLEQREEVNYPQGGYWGLAPCLRLQMLCDLQHDVLSTSIIREHIQKSLDEAQTWEREAEALARKEAKAIVREERNNRIARMIAELQKPSLTLEEQNEIKAAASNLDEPQAMFSNPKEPPSLACVRTVPLLNEKREAALWKVQSSDCFTGAADCVLMETGLTEGSSACWHVLPLPSAAN
eukprot:jgi/Botrbrau1/18691/Bobra.0386s0019.1